MNTDFINRRITIAGVVTLLKTLVFGAVTAESAFFSQVVASHLNVYIKAQNYETPAIWTGTILLLCTVIYPFIRDIIADCFKILRSARIDIFLVFIAGFLMSIFLKGIEKSWYENIVSLFTPTQVLMVFSIPILLAFAFLMRAFVADPFLSTPSLY